MKTLEGLMGKFSRNKGATYERDVCNRLRRFDDTARRNLQQYQKMDGNDITLDNLPFVVQCKTGYNPPIWEGVKEAMEAAKGTPKYAMAFVKRTWGDEIVAMPVKDFLSLLEEWWVQTGGTVAK